ncbi:MAG: hypothetical protein H6700_08415 [Myxococcales bacterium]|nr:hypothetical protein [Myxococcales bacterium]
MSPIRHSRTESQRRAAATLAAALLVGAPGSARAQLVRTDCDGAISLGGDPESMSALTASLAALGVRVAPGDDCPRVAVTGGSPLRVVATRGDGRTETRELVSVDAAAAWIQSWTQQSPALDLFVLVDGDIPPAPDHDDGQSPGASTTMPSAESEPSTETRRRDRGARPVSLFVDAGVGVDRAAEGWFDAGGGATVGLGRGAVRVRLEAATDIEGAHDADQDVSARYDLSAALGWGPTLRAGAVFVTPAIEAGIGWARTRPDDASARSIPENTLDAVGPRVGAALWLRGAGPRRVHAMVTARLVFDPTAGSRSREAETVTLAAPPTWRASVGLGVDWSAQ